MTSRPRVQRIAALIVLLSVLVVARRADATEGPEPPVGTGAGPAVELPDLAYYYIWFDPTSWNRAKSDLPLAGKYSSDERSVMEEHVRAAKVVGLDGFIVSWKHTEKLDRRLAALVDIAESEDFRLVVIYQGLDFAREPLPVPRVVADLAYFRATYIDRRAFHVFEKPAVILSGSWKFSREEVAAIGAGVGNDVLLLGSEKDVEGIRRLSGLIDGDAYYWSSVDPANQQRYHQRLQSMAAAVHETGGIWIPPAAPGFDARLVGGRSVVDRRDGGTLRQSFSAAMASSPDAIGIISWNEFSENSHLEPSRRYGTRYLEVLAELLDGRPPVEIVEGGDGVDSSAPGGKGSGLQQLAAFATVGAIVLAAGVVVGRRRPRRPEGEVP